MLRAKWSPKIHKSSKLSSWQSFETFKWPPKRGQKRSLWITWYRKLSGHFSLFPTLPGSLLSPFSTARRGSLSSRPFLEWISQPSVEGCWVCFEWQKKSMDFCWTTAFWPCPMLESSNHPLNMTKWPTSTYNCMGIYIYIYLEPKWPLFWLEKALFWGVELQN